MGKLNDKEIFSVLCEKTVMKREKKKFKSEIKSSYTLKNMYILHKEMQEISYLTLKNEIF